MSRVIAAFAQFLDENGDPISNGWLRFLQTNTNNTNKDTYADADQTIPNANPLQLDAEGRCPNVFGLGVYRVDLYKDNPVLHVPGELVQSFDPVTAESIISGSGGNFSEWDENTVYDVSNIVIYNGKYYRSITAGNVSNEPDVTLDQWEEITFLRYWNPNVVYEIDDVVIYNSALYFSILGANTGNIPLTSPLYWNPVGSGTVLLNWEESGTDFRPVFDGYYIGDPTHHVGTIYLDSFATFPTTPAADPTADYEVANKQYVDTAGNARMRWIGDWVPATYEINDVVRDDSWTMVAIAQTDDRPAPQPTGDAEYVRDSFSPPAFLTTSASEAVLYIGQRYVFVPAFFVTNVRIYLPTAAAGLNVEVWAVYNPTGSYRIVNIYPGFVVGADQTEKWLNLPVGQNYVAENTIIDVIMVIRSPAAENTFTYEWDYIRANGDPLPGDIYHQSGGNVDQIRVHEQDTSLTDRTLDLDNIGPGSTMSMDSEGITWEILEASKTGDVYTFIVDPGARAGAATSDFTFTYFAASAINYVYNTDLYISDARISGYFGNIYDPDNATYIDDNGYGVDIQVQNAIVSPDWEIVAQPPSVSAAGGGDTLGYWEESEEYFRPITDNVGYLGDSTHSIQGIYLSDNADIVTPTSEPITLNGELVYSANNGPLAGFRNKIINGNFDFWQRATSQTTSGYGSDDRWINDNGTSTKTHSQQAFTVGQTDVPGEPVYYSRTVVTTGGTAGSFVLKYQKIEDVRTFAGQTAMLSFYAKADSSKNIALEYLQLFGTGGSASVTAIGVTTFALTSSWQKFTSSVSIPSISGVTIGTGSSLALTFWFDAGSSFDARTNSLGNQSGTFDIAQVQLEPGPDATPFEQRHIGQELALCQRYYWTGTAHGNGGGFRWADGTLSFYFGNGGSFQVEMRAAPTMGFVTTPTYTNCTHSSFTASTNSWIQRVNVTASGRYRAISGVYYAESEL